jgi:hypothetical protein
MFCGICKHRGEDVGFLHVDDCAGQRASISLDAVAQPQRTTEQMEIILVHERAPGGWICKMHKYIALRWHSALEEVVPDIRRDLGMGDGQQVVKRLL